MHHGYGILDRAIKYLEKKDKDDFQKFMKGYLDGILT